MGGIDSTVLCRLLMELLHKEYQHNHPRSQHIETKHQLAKVTGTSDLQDILDGTLLDAEEIQVVKAKMSSRKTFCEIGDDLRISERTARRRYKSALAKIQSQI